MRHVNCTYVHVQCTIVTVILQNVVIGYAPLARQVIATTRELDPTRPVTFACANDYKVDRVVSSSVVYIASAHV